MSSNCKILCHSISMEPLVCQNLIPFNSTEANGRAVSVKQSLKMGVQTDFYAITWP